MRARASSTSTWEKPMPLLELEHVAVAYGDAPAVWDASLTVGDGELVSVIGPNGAGKSTLVNTIAGLQRARGGRLTFDGADLSAILPHRVCGHGMRSSRMGGALHAHERWRRISRSAAIARRPGRVRGTALARACTSSFRSCVSGGGTRRGRAAGGQPQMVAIGRALMGGARASCCSTSRRSGWRPRWSTTCSRSFARSMPRACHPARRAERGARPGHRVRAYVLERPRRGRRRPGRVARANAYPGGYLGVTPNLRQRVEHGADQGEGTS